MLSESSCREKPYYCMSMISKGGRRWRRTDHPSRGEVPPPSLLPSPVRRFDRISTSHSSGRGLYFSLPCFAFSFGLSPNPSQRALNFTDPSNKYIVCYELSTGLTNLISSGKFTVLGPRLLSPPRYRRGKPCRRSCCPLSNARRLSLLARAPREEGEGFLIKLIFKGRFLKRGPKKRQLEAKPRHRIASCHFPCAATGALFRGRSTRGGKRQLPLSWQGGES